MQPGEPFEMDDPMRDEHLKEGQFIIFSPFAGQDIKIGDEEYLVIPQEDIVVYKEEG